MKRRKGFYSISVVAKMFEVHQQTIRLYEKEGLITPHRSAGNTRQFTEEDVELLEKIIYLTHKLGINLAGVEMILKLQKKIDRMQNEMNKVFDQTKKELAQEAEVFSQVAKEEATQLVAIKHAKNKTTPQLVDNAEKEPSFTKKSSKTSQEAQEELLRDWEIDYEDL